MPEGRGYDISLFISLHERKQSAFHKPHHLAKLAHLLKLKWWTYIWQSTNKCSTTQQSVDDVLPRPTRDWWHWPSLHNWIEILKSSNVRYSTPSQLLDKSDNWKKNNHLSISRFQIISCTFMYTDFGKNVKINWNDQLNPALCERDLMRKHQKAVDSCILFWLDFAP